MTNVTLTNQTNSPIRIDTTHFGVNVPASANLVGTDLQIAEVYRDSGLGVLAAGSAPAFTSQALITDSEDDLIVNAVWTGTPEPTLSYEWSTSATETGTYEIILGVDTDTLQSAPVGWYKAKMTATNAFGSASTTSDPFHVTA